MRKRYSLITILMTLSLALQPVSFARPADVWAEEALDVQDEAEVFNADATEFPAEENGGIAGTPEEEALSAGEAGEAEDAIPAAEIPDEDPDVNEDNADYEVVADTDLSDTENADQTVPDAGTPDGDGSDDLLLIDGLIEEAESETEGGEVAPVMEELPLEDPDIAPDGVVTKTSGMPDLQAGGDGLEIMKLRTKRNASAASGAVVFSGSYGNQLSGFARQLYDLKAAHYVTKRSTSYWNPKFTADGNLCTFEAVCQRDASGNKSYVNNDASQAAKKSLRFAMQSSADAFKHDYPQTFWFRVPGTYSFGFKSDDWVEGETRTFYLQQILYKQVESFTGAYGLLNEVEAGEDRAAGQILDRASAEAGGTPSDEQVLREILDYVDARAFYDYSALSDAESISAAEKEGSKKVQDVFRIYTCAGLFADSVSSGVVCEGYAKAVKVLCDREDIGIPCVLLCGANHMWNAVQLDGSWYLLDPTWCDTSSDYRYFLTYDARHQEMTSSNFSGSETTTLFTTPVLASACFDTAHNYAAGSVHKCSYCSRELGSGYTVKETITAFCGARGARVFTDESGNLVTCYIRQKDPSSHSYGEMIIAPTCTEQGYTLCTCSSCGAEEKRDYTEMTPHDYVEKETVAPTCTEQGYTVYKCSRCEAEEKRDYTEMIPHDYEEKETVVPTCTEQGYTVYKCSRCEAEEKRDYTDPDQNAHDYEEKETIAPTCTEQGYTVYKCSRCEAEEKRDYTDPDQNAHDYVEKETVAPTCTEQGYTVYKCSRCEAEEKRDYTDPDQNAHDYVEKETVAPTCTEQGYTVYKCSRCEAETTGSYKEKIPHSYLEEVVPSTCKARGYTHYVCSECGAVSEYRWDYTDVLPHNYVEKETIASTCSEAGYIKSKCIDCGSEHIEMLEKIPHEFTAKIVKPTCTEQGYTRYTCSVCGAVEVRDYKSLKPHTYTETAVEATASSEGYTEHTCTVCGFSYKDGFTPKLLSKKPVLKKIKLSGKRTLKLRWKKAGSYTRYEVQYALSPDFSDAVTRFFKVKASDGKTITRKIRVKKDRRYYVRVRAVSGDRVSAWSNVRKKKTKK